MNCFYTVILHVFVFEGVQITVRINQNILSLGKIQFHKNMTDPAKGWQLILKYLPRATRMEYISFMYR